MGEHMPQMTNRIAVLAGNAAEFLSWASTRPGTLNRSQLVLRGTQDEFRCVLRPEQAIGMDFSSSIELPKFKDRKLRSLVKIRIR